MPPTQEVPSLNVAVEFNKLRKKFADDPKQGTFNALICGEMGTGKTHILKTCRKPVIHHCFDPGGWKTLKEEIDRGEIISSNFAPDDPFRPWAFREWTKEFQRLEKSGIFAHVGTYSLDSSTMWAEAILSYFLQKRGAAAHMPDGKQDYMPQKTEIRNWMSRILSLPCDVIVTGHLEPEQDSVTGRTTYRYATTGKGTFLIPAQFDEVYVTLSEDTAQGVKYNLLTAGAGRYAARSRLASGGKLAAMEQPNIKAILKKAGYPTSDKPLFLNSNSEDTKSTVT